MLFNAPSNERNLNPNGINADLNHSSSLLTSDEYIQRCQTILLNEISRLSSAIAQTTPRTAGKSNEQSSREVKQSDLHGDNHPEDPNLQKSSQSSSFDEPYCAPLTRLAEIYQRYEQNKCEGQFLIEALYYFLDLSEQAKADQRQQYQALENQVQKLQHMFRNSLRSINELKLYCEGLETKNGQLQTQLASNNQFYESQVATLTQKLQQCLQGSTQSPSKYAGVSQSSIKSDASHCSARESLFKRKLINNTVTKEIRQALFWSENRRKSFATNSVALSKQNGVNNEKGDRERAVNIGNEAQSLTSWQNTGIEPTQYLMLDIANGIKIDFESQEINHSGRSQTDRTHDHSSTQAQRYQANMHPIPPSYFIQEAQRVYAAEDEQRVLKKTYEIRPSKEHFQQTGKGQEIAS